MTFPPSEPPLPALPPRPPSEAVSNAILEHCCRELAPCQERSISRRLATSVALSATFVLALFGVAWRSNLSEHSFVGVVAIALGWGLLQLSVLVVGLGRPPGKRLSRPWRWSAIAAALGIALLQPVLLVLGGVGSPRAPGTPGMVGALTCAALSLACGAFVSGALMLVWRRTDPFSPGLSGALLGVSGGLAGAVAVAFTCTNHELSHLWLGHVLVVVLLTFLGALAGKRWLAP